MPELFEFVEEAFDAVALFVEIDVLGAQKLATSLRRDDDLGSGAIASYRWSAS
jgi:hypothetical protein